MKIEKNRHLILLNAFVSSSDPITSDDLAALVHASSRTVKSDIAELDEMLRQESIAAIISEKAKGYHLEALNADKFIQFQNQVYNLVGFYGDRPVEATNRRLFIIQKLLSNDYVKTEDLAESLYVSRSVISSDLARVEKFLLTNGVATVSVPGSGLHLEGSESDLRACMVEANCTQYHDFELGYPVPEFTSQFYNDRQDYEDIRHAMLKVIRESQITLTDIDTKRCATYLVLIRGRRKRKKYVSLDAGITNEIRLTYEYKVAQKVFEVPIIREYAQPGEEDILDFTRMILVGRDFDLRHLEEIRLVQPAYLAASSTLLENALADIRENTIGSSFYKMPLFARYNNDFESITLHIFMENHFASCGREHIVTYTENSHYRVSPVCMQMTRDLVTAFEKQIHHYISGSSITSFGELCNYIMKKVDYEYKPRRLAVVSFDGRAVGEQMKESLLDHYGRYISVCDVFAQYELRRVNFSDYDAFVTEKSEEIDNRYPLPCVPYYALAPFGSVDELFHNLFLPGFSIDFLNHMKEVTECYTNFEIQNMQAMLQFMVYHYGQHGKEKNLIRQLSEDIRIHPYFAEHSSTAIIFLNYNDTNREILDLYQLKTPISSRNTITQENGNDVKYIVVCCEPPSLKVEDLKLYDRMLTMLEISEEWIGKLLNNVDDAWDEAFEIVMRNRFNNVK